MKIKHSLLAMGVIFAGVANASVELKSSDDGGLLINNKPAQTILHVYNNSEALVKEITVLNIEEAHDATVYLKLDFGNVVVSLNPSGGITQLYRNELIYDKDCKIVGISNANSFYQSDAIYVYTSFYLPGVSGDEYTTFSVDRDSLVEGYEYCDSSAGVGVGAGDEISGYAVEVNEVYNTAINDFVEELKKVAPLSIK
ncbi:hypothetical protein A9264_13615 [Vibrio sp. UCD-FRSSP16_10]|uniref:hypothetical protein n=1 Tax=unclassified Vibrio TaxID=2614977 RepID=UPI0007FDFD93|nr:MULTISPECIES: hypothetical protein [unclassified Vibrio]OBT14809.1 hypothetical protein A9260_13830 [Vibrio sp. UCD-FRSSP16_30]OBT20098.1 hypothetical protein A9264_13615 [Vibrio sp. UCD-FRSSP16_10]